MQRYATVKLRILVVPVVLALLLCGCSKDASEMNSLKASAAEAADSSNDATSRAGNTAKVKDASAEKKDAAEEGTREAKDGHSAAAKDWSDFQVMVKRCDTLTGAENKQCVMDARDTYRASNFNCDTMASQYKAQCQSYSERWKSVRTLDKNSAGLVALLILFRVHPGDRIWPNER
jgi:hypothetical protein